MHLVFSEKLDPTTNLVANWLSSNNELAIIEDYNKLDVVLNNVDDIVLKYSNIYVNLNDIDKVWFRRGKVYLNHKVQKDEDVSFFKYNFEISKIVQNHVNFLISLKKECIGNPNLIDVNKLQSLLIAKNVGFDIPKSIVTDKLSKVVNSFKNKKVITKLLYPLKAEIDKKYLNFLTFECDFNTMDDDFSLSFFQEKIEKLYEIRVFFIKGEIFCKAIFSQYDKQTSLDYRNYNMQRPNREVPYNLPLKVKKKVVKFMEKIKLDTGSLDIILSKEGLFYFLEVNPIGQFSDMSYNCNYYIEKKIAQYLSNQRSFK